MKKYKYTWEHCYGDIRGIEFTANDIEEARQWAKNKTIELGEQITNKPELMELGDLIDF